MMRRFIAISLCVAAFQASADTLDINLSNDAAQFKYSMVSGIAGKSDLFASFMYNDVNSLLAEGGLLVMNEEGSVPGLSLGIGAKLAVASLNKIAPDRKLVSGVALGAQVRYEIPADRRFAFVGEYHYAPKIISFGDSERYYQGAARAEYAVSALTQAYIGFRTTKFYLANQGECVLDNGPHLGVKLAF